MICLDLTLVVTAHLNTPSYVEDDEMGDEESEEDEDGVEWVALLSSVQV